MQYNFQGIRTRIEAIEGGYGALADKMGISNSRLSIILSGTTQPKLSTMTKLNTALKELEERQAEVVNSNPEIFLPHSVVFTTLCV